MENISIYTKNNIFDIINKKLIRRKIIKLLKSDRFKDKDALRDYFLKLKSRYKGFATSVIQDEIKRENTILITKIHDFSSPNENGKAVEYNNIYGLDTTELIKGLNGNLNNDDLTMYITKVIKWTEPNKIPTSLNTFLKENREVAKIVQGSDPITFKLLINIFLSKNPKSLTDENINELLDLGYNRFSVEELKANPNLIRHKGVVISGKVDKDLIIKFPEFIDRLSDNERNEIHITMEDVYNNRHILSNPAYDQFLPMPKRLEDFKKLPEFFDKPSITEKFIKAYLMSFNSEVDKRIKAMQEDKSTDRALDINYLQMIKSKTDRLISNRSNDDKFNFSLKGLMPLFETAKKAVGTNVDITRNLKKIMEGKPSDVDYWKKTLDILEQMVEVEEKVPKFFCKEMEKAFFNPNVILGLHCSVEKDYNLFFKNGLRNRSETEGNISANDLTFTVQLQKDKYLPNGKELYELLNYKLFNGLRIAICVPKNSLIRSGESNPIPIWKVSERFPDGGIKKTNLLPNYIMGAYIEDEHRYLKNPEFDLEKRYQQQKENGKDVFVPNVNYKREKEQGRQEV